MENDSLDMDVAQDVGVVQDSVAPMPTAEQLGISVVAGPRDQDGSLLPMAATVGDTVDFPVTVSWSVQGSALLVVPTSSATAKGLEQVALSQESARSVKDGKEVASITFTYKILAQDSGNLNIPAMRFEIPTPMGQSLDLRSESVAIRVEAPFNPLPFAVGGVVAVCVGVLGILRIRRKAAARASLAARNAAADRLREKMMVLKQRINSADCRQWLLDLENVCKDYAAERFMLDAEKVNLEILMKQGNLEDWKPLLEKFADARYGGGARDSFENRETWKIAMKLMGIEEE